MDRMDRLLTALAEHRESRAPLLGLLLDLRQTVLNPSTIELGGDSPWGPLGEAELATLADLALGSAIRDRLGPEIVLSTITLGLALHRVAAENAATARATVANATDGPLSAVAELHTPAGRLGRAHATFAPARTGSAAPLPWEAARPDGAVAAVAEDDLDAHEREVVAAVERLAGSGLQGLAGARWTSNGGAMEAEITPGLPLLNRSGNVQGGVLLGLATSASRALVAGPWRLLEAHVQFVAPVPVAPLRVRAEPVRIGRSIAFATVLLTQDDTSVARAAVTLCRVPQPLGESPTAARDDGASIAGALLDGE
jgi:acyl-coenzyme A thioesterase PaaI-like protein